MITAKTNMTQTRTHTTNIILKCFNILKNNSQVGDNTHIFYVFNNAFKLPKKGGKSWEFVVICHSF